MLIMRRKGWEIAARHVTPEAAFGRRTALLGVAGLLATGSVPAPALAQGAPRNAKYEAGRAMTDEGDATSYNNYYEFGTSKSISRAAQRLPITPWAIKVDGMVETPRTIDLDDIIKQVSVEERVYRHRCVEGWGMTVPWTGFALKDLVAQCKPLASAKYIQFETLNDPKTMSGVRSSQFEWPYVEGVTMAEAANDLSFLATGLYGKAIPKQNGAPIRLVLPWKYGFKSVKSIVRMTFTDQKPKTFWEGLQPVEYGFWANVNPAVPHPRWSQATERLLTSDERVPTQIFNGYGPFVASLYTGLQSERLYV